MHFFPMSLIRRVLLAKYNSCSPKISFSLESLSSRKRVLLLAQKNFWAIKIIGGGVKFQVATKYEKNKEVGERCRVRIKCSIDFFFSFSSFSLWQVSVIW